MVHSFRKDGAWRPGAWCTRPPCGRSLGDALALSHGLALDLDGIGIVDDSVTDGISQGRVVQVFMPLAGVILGTENGGGHLVSGLYQFQHIPRLCLLEGVEQPLVQNKQLLFPELFHVVPVGSVSPGYGDLHQQIWQTDIPDGIKAVAGSHAKGAGQVSLSGTGGSQNDDIVGFLEVGAGGQAQDLLPIQPSFRVVLNIFDTGGRDVYKRQKLTPTSCMI